MAGVEAPQEDEREEEHEHDDHECGHNHEAGVIAHELGAPLARQLGVEQRFLEVRAPFLRQGLRVLGCPSWTA